MSSDSVISNSDGSSFLMLNTSTDLLTYYKQNISQYSGISFTTVSQVTASPGVVFSVIMKQLVFANNTYTSNYASSRGGIIKIRGTTLAMVNSEYLLNNGEAFDEKLLEYSSSLIKPDPSGLNTYLYSFLNNGVNQMRVISILCCINFIIF